ncbi:phytanoyl-CoA dioxygenase family protein [Roseivirga misakiensis]|uniref:Phytanoyl-CoA dioxygenase n=1 Tax=Roseivirga misakiensis TaxID=1563681 RepID=A0A1E5T1G1_9BACT|nr:phytanoyl-CoA dioxygenase family protein [Roseivirga misakiensis]OEK05218.1 hypothetical protein BFP71_17600 [Roseivirga misakiensis]
MTDNSLLFRELDNQDLQNFRNDGFCLKSDFVNQSFVDKIRDKAKSVFARQITAQNIELESLEDVHFEKALYALFKKDFHAFIGAAKLCQHTMELHQLAIADDLINNLKVLGLEEPAICVKPIIFFNSRHISKIEGHYKTPGHQDWRSMQGSINSMVVWIPLMDLNRELGTLEIVPGSHRSGLYKSEEDEWFRNIPESEIPESEYVSIDVKKGDALFFSSFLVHRSGNNSSENIRWSMHFRYNDMNESTFIERKFPHPYKVYHPEKGLVTPDFPKRQDLAKVFL